MDNFEQQEYYVVSSSTNPVQMALNVDLNRGFTHVAVTSACIPKTYYVLPTDAKIIVNQGAAPVTVTMEAGNYNVVNFKTLFTNKINNTPGINPFAYSVSFRDTFTQVQDGKYTFSVTGNAGVQPIFTVMDPYLARVMGFNPKVPYSFVGGTLTSANVINFQSYDEMLILSNMVQNQRNLLQELFSSGSTYNSSIIWNNTSLPLNAKRLAPTSSNIYNFALVDSDNQLIHLNGSEWSFILMFFKTNDFQNVIKKFIAVTMLEQQNKQLE